MFLSELFSIIILRLCCNHSFKYSQFSEQRSSGYIVSAAHVSRTGEDNSFVNGCEAKREAK